MTGQFIDEAPANFSLSVPFCFADLVSLIQPHVLQVFHDVLNDLDMAPLGCTMQQVASILGEKKTSWGKARKDSLTNAHFRDVQYFPPHPAPALSPFVHADGRTDLS